MSEREGGGMGKKRDGRGREGKVDSFLVVIVVERVTVLSLSRCFFPNSFLFLSSDVYITFMLSYTPLIILIKDD